MRSLGWVIVVTSTTSEIRSCFFKPGAEVIVLNSEEERMVKFVEKIRTFRVQKRRNYENKKGANKDL